MLAAVDFPDPFGPAMITAWGEGEDMSKLWPTPPLSNSDTPLPLSLPLPPRYGLPWISRNAIRDETMPHVHEYAATIEWTGAQRGSTASYAAYSREHRISIVGKPDLIGSADPAFRGDGSLYNPEDLLLAAASTCHMLSYLAICARQGIGVTSYTDSCTARMEPKGGTMAFVEVILNPVVGLGSGDRDKAMELHHQAHDECYVAASVNFPIRCRPTLLES